MRKALACVVAAASLVGCAKSPDSIAPAYVSTVTYMSWSCKDLGDESSRLSSALATASTQQENARTNDTMGVVFIGLPVSTLSGDNVAPQIADLKGRIEAVHEASIEKHCN
jgi:hypothetical protein